MMKQRQFKKKLYHDKELMLWLKSFTDNGHALFILSQKYNINSNELYQVSSIVLAEMLDYDLENLYKLFNCKIKPIGIHEFLTHVKRILERIK